MRNKAPEQKETSLSLSLSLALYGVGIPAPSRVKILPPTPVAAGLAKPRALSYNKYSKHVSWPIISNSWPEGAAGCGNLRIHSSVQQIFPSLFAFRLSRLSSFRRESYPPSDRSPVSNDLCRARPNV